MKSGEKAEVFCPYNLVYGKTPMYGHFGSDEIPPRSDMIFDIDVLACTPSKKPGKVILVPPPTTIKEKKTIVSAQSLVDKMMAKVITIQ